MPSLTAGKKRILHIIPSLRQGGAEKILSTVVTQTADAYAHQIVTLLDDPPFFDLGVGVGGSTANSGHAVNDFRKLCGIEAYAPTDNVSELSARTNDEGWHTVFSERLKVSRISPNDALLILSVGGGAIGRNVSPNIVAAVDEAKTRGARILGIVGRDGGYTRQAGDVVVVISTVEETRVTPHAEAFQAVIWHCLVSHPSLQKNATKW